VTRFAQTSRDISRGDFHWRSGFHGSVISGLEPNETQAGTLRQLNR